MIEQSPPASALRALLIADIRGYTPYTVEHGDQASKALVQRFQQGVREAIGDEGVAIQFQKGDECLCVFPSAHAALQAAVALRQRFEGDAGIGEHIPVGMGLSEGEVAETEGRYEGMAIIIASRLCGVAEVGQALADERIAAVAASTPGVRVVPRGERYLKGIASPVQIYAVFGADENTEPSLAERVLVAVAEYQNRSERNFHIGIPNFTLVLPTMLEMDEQSEEWIMARDAVDESVREGLIVHGGSNAIRLTGQGWHRVQGRVPGSERDSETIQAIVAAWRDPSVIKQQQRWIPMDNVYERMHRAWDKYAALNDVERLYDQGLLDRPKEQQAVWVRPKKPACDLVEKSGPA